MRVGRQKENENTKNRQRRTSYSLVKMLCVL